MTCEMDYKNREEPDRAAIRGDGNPPGAGRNEFPVAGKALQQVLRGQVSQVLVINLDCQQKSSRITKYPDSTKILKMGSKIQNPKSSQLKPPLQARFDNIAQILALLFGNHRYA